ncbi:adenosylcobinamide-GDP ribazoletransferase [Merdimmobilis hominis]|uniref:adenosylcobinamide-GDP ribazoletransferase n=1 Tax=Merdimmobilis hominis TaxID=2897707 RepID=UPI0035132730
MKGFWETVVVAFSLYSALPMPQIPWNKGNMGYAMAAFPLVGLVVGGAQVLWACLVPQMGFSTPWVAAAVAAILPVAVTGGIHLDGFCDVSDALASHASREKKLEIMKDSHAGAFALIVLGCYFVLTFALWAELYAAPSRQAEILVGLGYLLSRGMAACSVVSFPKAKDSGLLRTFSDSAQKRGVFLWGISWSALAAVGMVALQPVQGGIALLLAALWFCYYFYKSRREFGGITGDLAGWFLTVCELLILAGVLIGGRILG